MNATGDVTGLTHSDNTFDVTYANHDVVGRPGSVTESRNGIPTTTTTTLEYNHFSGSLTETHPSDHPYLPDLKVEARADDQRGRPTGHIVKNDGASIHGWTIGYDTLGRVGSLEGHNLTVTLAYHPGSNRLATQTTFPLPLGEGQGEGAQSALLTRSMNIDLLGRTYGVIHTAPDPDAGNTPRIVTALAHGHDIQGRRKSARREDGTVWNYDYNTRSEVTGAEKRENNSDLVPGLNFAYNYDGLGNRLTASKGTPALVTEYEPDAMNRYASITSPGGDDILVRSATAVDIEVDEEPVAVTSSGNFRSARITATNNTAGPAFPEISITGQDNFSESGHRWIPQAEFSPQYDDDGNLTNDGRWIYTWDAMNRLTGMTPTTAALAAGVPNQTLSCAYDHLGRRIAKKVTTTTGQGTTIKDFRYLYEGWNVVAQFTADTNNFLTPDATFLWSVDLSGTIHGAGGVGGLHSINLYSGGEADTLGLASYDANGNIIAWTDASGRVLQRQDYDPFGNRVIRERLAITPEQSDRLEYGFSTKPLDAETGLIYYIHRYYGPRHGQWLSKDPIEEYGGLNLYGFVGNNSVSFFDLLGLYVPLPMQVPIAPPPPPPALPQTSIPSPANLPSNVGPAPSPTYGPYVRPPSGSLPRYPWSDPSLPPLRPVQGENSALPPGAFAPLLGPPDMSEIEKHAREKIDAEKQRQAGQLWLLPEVDATQRFNCKPWAKNELKRRKANGECCTEIWYRTKLSLRDCPRAGTIWTDFGMFRRSTISTNGDHVGVVCGKHKVPTTAADVRYGDTMAYDNNFPAGTTGAFWMDGAYIVLHPTRQDATFWRAHLDGIGTVHVGVPFPK